MLPSFAGKTTVGRHAHQGGEHAMPRQPRFTSAIASGILVVAGGVSSIAAVRAQEPPADADRPPFASPLTDEEGRWLLDAEEGQRFRSSPERQFQKVAPRDLPPQIRAIQRSMGGSLLERFDELHRPGTRAMVEAIQHAARQPEQRTPIWPDPSAENAPPGMWPNWSSPAAPATVVRATAEAPAVRPSAPIAALRAAAAELDNAANRLEELELYSQSDALRELAQRFRIDARRLTPAGDSPLHLGSFPSRSRRRGPTRLPLPLPPTVSPANSAMPVRRIAPRDKSNSAE
jgi:hypothetical protein